MFHFQELDDVRDWMVAEIQNAIDTETLYFSRRFNEMGKEAWPGLLLFAAQHHNEHWLAFQLEYMGTMKNTELKSKPKGGYTHAHVPEEAVETLADCEFNRYYMCGICRRAIRDGNQSVTVYRAKHRREPRVESQAIIGTSYNPNVLIVELRKSPGKESHPLCQPNSGLSIHT